ncbi:MAG: 2-dehydropantoate 2-reductase [bacterium]|nr:2-dehydropantoate 2-reductase [bacterium]
MTVRIAVVGAGALGLYYGGLLAKHRRDGDGKTRPNKADHRVAFLARSDYAALGSRGLVVHSTDGDFKLAADELEVFDGADPAALARDFGPVDLLLIGLKTTANAEAYAKLLPPLFHADRTVLLCLQNGLGNEASLAELFPPERILGGTAFLCSNRIAPGEIEHTEHAMIHLAPYSKAFAAPRDALTPEAVRDLFEASGVDCQVRPNYIEMRWRKQIWNVPFNALCTIHNCGTDQLLAMPGMADRVSATMREIIYLGESINAALLERNLRLPAARRINCGEYRLSANTDEIVAEQLAKTRAMNDYKPSMLLDYRAGRPLEYEAIFGACLRERAAYAPDCAIPEIEAIAGELRLAAAIAQP